MTRGQIRKKRAGKGGSPGRMRKSALVKAGLATKGETFRHADEKQGYLSLLFRSRRPERDSHVTFIPYADEQQHFEAVARRRAERNRIATRKIIRAMYRSRFGMKPARARRLAA